MPELVGDSRHTLALTGRDITPAEMAALRLIAQGMTNHQIARALGKRPSTVKVQTASILKKLGVHSRTSAAIWYWRNEAGMNRPREKS
jgi:DNA-binding NarL/FixJ family response regulator